MSEAAQLMLFGNDTLAEARALVESNLDEGMECPCCGQLARKYKRKLNSTMARGLIWLVRQGPRWVDVPAEGPRWLTKTNQHATLRWWDLVERLSSDDPAKKHSGMWQATQVGIDFVYRRTTVPAHVYHFNNTVMGFSGESIDIEAALGSHFDYAEMMGWR